MSTKEYKKEYNPYSGAVETYYWDDVAKVMTIKNHYEMTDIIEDNKRRQNASIDSRFGDEMLHHIAEVPLGVVELWLKEGIDVFSADPDMKRKVLRKLHDPEWRYLRTTVKSIL